MSEYRTGDPVCTCRDTMTAGKPWCPVHDNFAGQPNTDPVVAPPAATEPECGAVDRRVKKNPVICTRKAGHKGDHWNKDLLLKWATEPADQAVSGEPETEGDSVDVISALVAMAEKSVGDDERWLLYAVKRLRYHADSGGQRDLAPMQGSSSLGVPPAHVDVFVEKDAPANPESEPVAWRIEARTTGWPPGEWKFDDLLENTGTKPNPPPSPNGIYEYRARPLYTHPSEGEGARAALDRLETEGHPYPSTKVQHCAGFSDGIAYSVKFLRAALASRPAATEERGEQCTCDRSNDQQARIIANVACLVHGIPPFAAGIQRKER